jgi:methionyl aminopeptidase
MKITSSNSYRTTCAEKRHLDNIAHSLPSTTYNSIRRASQVHRLVRQHARQHIKPGMTLTEAVENIEDGVRALVEEDGLESGIGFPTGINKNEIAAHYSPNAGDSVGGYFVLSSPPLSPSFSFY